MYQCRPGLCNSSGPLEKLSMDRAGCGPGDSMQEEDRCFQHVLGSSVLWQTYFWPLVKSGGRATHQLPGNAGPSDLLDGHNGILCSGPLGQHDCGVLHKSLGRALLEAPLHSGRAPLGMGSAQLAFTKSNTCDRLNQGADMLSQSKVPSEEWILHPKMVQRIWEIFGKAEVDFFNSEDNSHCPT